jgi:hypothetical protein
MPKFSNDRRNMGDVWTFETAMLRVVVTAQRDYNYRYDGDDESGEVQDKLDSGEYVAFDTFVRVYLLSDVETPLSVSSLCGSVYTRDSWKDFFTAHRCADRATGGHYFPEMVREACAEARIELQRLRDTFPILR